MVGHSVGPFAKTARRRLPCHRSLRMKSGHSGLPATLQSTCLFKKGACAFNCVCECKCECECVSVEARSTGTLEAEVTGSCESPEVGAET